MNSIITTHTGGRFDILDPKVEDINIEDIAHALSMQCRFNGHCSQFYSVAQHSVRVASLLYDAGHGDRTTLRGLIHDATEAYLGDVITPLKDQLPQYREIEERVNSVIEFRFNLFAENPEEKGLVKQADTAMLLAEARDLMPKTDLTWTRHDTTFDVSKIAKIFPQSPEDAKHTFMSFFYLVYKGD